VTAAPPPVDGVEHHFVFAGGLRTHVAEAGEGPPLLLVHGWPQHWYQWRKVIEGLRGERRLIAPDLRGFGWTDAPAGPIGPDVFAADLVALLDALGLDRVDVAGHDWGGFTSLLLAARHPDRVRRVLALSTAHPWVEATPRVALELWRGWYALPLAAGLTERDPRLAAWFLRREGLAPADVEAYVGRLRERARAAATTRLYRSYLRTVARALRPADPEPRTSAPVLLLLGDHDLAISPRFADSLERGGDNMRAETLPGAGHFVCDTHADVVADRARAHLGA
jgi:pimeloyl-ACP methyl ester carboxylesterase